MKLWPNAVFLIAFFLFSLLASCLTISKATPSAQPTAKPDEKTTGLEKEWEQLTKRGK